MGGNARPEGSWLMLHGALEAGAELSWEPRGKEAGGQRCSPGSHRGRLLGESRDVEERENLGEGPASGPLLSLGGGAWEASGRAREEKQSREAASHEGTLFTCSLGVRP